MFEIPDLLFCAIFFVTDEAHNIDNVCIEALSVDLEEPMLRGASQNVTQLRSAISGAKREASERLEREYTRLVTGLARGGGNVAGGGQARERSTRVERMLESEEVPATPVLPNDVVKEAIPDSIKRAEEFVGFLSRLVSFLQRHATTEVVMQERPTPFLNQIGAACSTMDRKVFRGVHERLVTLLLTIHVSSWAEFAPLLLVGDFVTVLATYEKEGMAVITEPYDDFTGDYRPLLRIACLDASLAIRWIVEKFRCVVITSGTLSPLDTYPRMLNFQVVVSASFNMSMDRRCVCPLVMTRGSDQMALSSKYADRQTPDIPRNYGHALCALAECVPDGIVVFFVSYVFMQQVVRVWNEECEILNELRKLKLVFVETQDPIEASLAIQNYKIACDSGRGAILLSVARGRAAEGIDFDGQYGRAVILFGVPFQYTESRVLKARLQFLAERYQIQEDDFLVFDAMRQAAQCAGRVIRNKNDYGVVLFADKRFSRGKLRNKLPKWILQFLTSQNLDLDVGSAMGEVKSFLLEMAQPTEGKMKFEASEPVEYERLKRRRGSK